MPNIRVTAEIEMVPIECPVCGLMWTMSAKVHARRTAANSDAPLFCPAGHSQTPGKPDVHADIEALRQHVLGFEVERVDLLRRLEAAEKRAAPLAGFPQTPAPPDAQHAAARQQHLVEKAAAPKAGGDAKGEPPPLDLTRDMQVKPGDKPPTPDPGAAFRFGDDKR